jgi:hypothetical protein
MNEIDQEVMMLELNGHMSRGFEKLAEHEACVRAAEEEVRQKRDDRNEDDRMKALKIAQSLKKVVTL